MGGESCQKVREDGYFGSKCFDWGKGGGQILWEGFRGWLWMGWVGICWNGGGVRDRSRMGSDWGVGLLRVRFDVAWWWGWDREHTEITHG